MASLPPAPWKLPFTSEQASLALAGGKGANLARLTRAGFPVPPGFVLTTRAYLHFVAANDLQPRIDAALAEYTGGEGSPEELEAVSARIRAMFAAAPVPAEIDSALREAYAELGRPAAAVRSSATAEDLPGLSFAGQQDTFLNVQGEEALLQAVVRCWSSLWTARAIGYRRRSGIPHSDAALAVVVQLMVPGEVSGVLFTANPLNGLRTETVIDAAWGLGEALVAGLVEPDHYVVDPHQGRILSRSLGSKALSVRGQEGGGTVQVREEAGQRQALSDEQILALARLGKQVEAALGGPQDIEWALAGDALHLLQARPITTLFPLPEGMPPEPLRVMFSVGAVQGMLDPITPLGRDVLGAIIAAGGTLLGYRAGWRPEGVVYTAGERLWADIAAAFRSPIARKALPRVMGMVEPGLVPSLDEVLADPRLRPGRRPISFTSLRRLVRFAFPIAWNVARNLRAPAARRAWIVARGEALLADFSARCEAIQGDRHERLRQRLELITEVIPAIIPGQLRLFLSGVTSGMASLYQLNAAARRGNGGTGGLDERVLEVTRGLPDNPTTEMDLKLWRAAQALQRDTQSREAFSTRPAKDLAAAWLKGALPPAAQAICDDFLAQYGGRGLAEIDLGRPRWREEPAYVMETLAAYLRIQNPDAAPDAVFARSAEQAAAAVEALAGEAGWFRARLVRFFAGRARVLLALREVPKFFFVRLLARVRWALLESGQEFAASGEIERPDDLFYLHLDELFSLAAGQPGNWQERIAGRREVYRIEMARRQVPRLLFSDGRAIYEGITLSDESGALHGSPVSPGSVVGRVRVVENPLQAQLQQGEILVCRGTDPSWTPLFLTAAGLVMEVGGMMTHGAVVAREYGIPAVVGVDQVTRRLRTGQLVRVDGSSGWVVPLDGGADPAE